jgi:signal transduction histidine kinase
VSDTGTGIPEHARSKVFEPFFTTKEVGKGTGQGLSMAHACIVNRHQGSIRFETTLGQGTTFIVRIPIAGPSTGADASS